MSTRRLSVVLLLLCVSAASAAQSPPDAPPQRPLRVLMLFPSELMLPWAVQQSDTTRSAIRAALSHDVDFFPEGLDMLRMPGADNEAEFVALLLKRYQSIPPDLIVVHGPMAAFVRRQRAALWPGVPMMVVSKISGLPSSDYPSDIPGTSVSYDVAGTVELALRLQPEARRLVVVGGGPQFGREELDNARLQLEPYRNRLAIEYITHAVPQELERQLAALPRDAIVLQMSIMRPASGKFVPPHELAQRLAKSSNAPSYDYYDEMLGSDFVGGSMANWLGQKDMIGVIARELLMGEPRRESLRMHPPVASVCSVDWTQLQHWQLPANRLPAGCQVLFRPPPFWEQYKRETAAIAIVLLIQSALIIALILQRHRRHVAELELQNQRAQLAHASRLATVGELSASIAHEINQPLSAILSNAEAGSRLIAAGKAQLTELHEIFDAIRDDDMRASEVILRMRRLLRLEPNDAQPLDVNEAVESILRLTAGAARKNGVVVRCDLDRTIPPVKGDYVQIQQVLLNLVLNAMEAMADTPPERRQVSISTGARPPGQVEICVADRGPGIEPDKLSKVFEPFFTSKANGMGLGLSITRSIVHAHHGKIRVESNSDGATFRVSFPT